MNAFRLSLVLSASVPAIRNWSKVCSSEQTCRLKLSTIDPLGDRKGMSRCDTSAVRVSTAFL